MSPLKTLSAAVLLFAGCVSARSPLPVDPPRSHGQASAECRALGSIDLKSKALPKYPVAAMRNGQQGWVVVKVDVEDGIVKRPEVIDASPKGIFESHVLAWADGLRYASGRSARSCLLEYYFKIT
jgi:outer membrane biosynthesis protein TonB